MLRDTKSVFSTDMVLTFDKIRVCRGFVQESAAIPKKIRTNLFSG